MSDSESKAGLMAEFTEYHRVHSPANSQQEMITGSKEFIRMDRCYEFFEQAHINKVTKCIFENARNK